MSVCVYWGGGHRALCPPSVAQQAVRPGTNRRLSAWLPTPAPATAVVAHPAGPPLPTPQKTTRTQDNCNLVIADFLIRHAYFTPDMRGYLELLAGLRQGDCS